MEIKPIKIVKGQGLAQLLTEKSNSHAVNLASEHESHILHIDEDHELYKDIIYFLRNLFTIKEEETQANFRKIKQKEDQQSSSWHKNIFFQ